MNTLTQYTLAACVALVFCPLCSAQFGDPSPPKQPPAQPPTPSTLESLTGHAALGGITLPTGYRFVEKNGGFCSYFGGISGPNDSELTLSVWTPAPAPGKPLHSGHYTGGVRVMHPDRYKQRIINGETVDWVLIDNNTLMASYPNRALDLSAHVKHPEQLVDAIAIILSVANDARHLEWADAVVILEQASLKRVAQTAPLKIQIETKNGVTYQAVEPETDAALKVLTRAGMLKPKQPGGKPSDLIYPAL